MKKIFIAFLFFTLTLIFLFPITKGLMVLPLDLLVSNYSPWNQAGQILLKNPYMQDSIIQLYPWKHLVFESLKNGILPFWNPYQLMGMPFMASMKPMVFYPLNILGFLGPVLSWNLLLFLQIFLSLIFSYLLAKDFKLGFFPSLLVSLAFSLNTLMIGILEFGSEGHAILWLPFFILCAKRYIENKNSIYLFLLGSAIGISIFAGQLQYTGYSLIILLGFIYFYGRHLKEKIKTYLMLMITIALGVGISAIQLIPSLELFSTSIRGATSSFNVFSKDLIKTQELFRLFAPDLFGNPTTRDLNIGYIETSAYFGIATLFFTFYAIIFSRKNFFVNFFTGTFFTSMFLSLQNLGLILFFLKIPLITSGSGSRIFLLVIFSASILAGFGLSEFIKSKNFKKDIKAVILFLGAFILIMAASALGNYFNGALKNFLHNQQFAFLFCFLFISITILYLYFKNKNKNYVIVFLIAIILLTYFDLFRIGYRFLTFSNTKFLYPQIPIVNFVKDYSKENLTRNIGLTEPEISTVLQVYTAETYNPLYPIRSAKVMDALQKKPDNFPDNKYIINRQKENTKYALDFLGISLVVAPKDVNSSSYYYNSAKFQETLFPIFEDGNLVVYKNKDAYPRFGLFYKEKTIKNDNEILKIIYKRDFDFKNSVILEENLPINLNNGTGSAKLLFSGLNNQKFEVETNKPALFYISDTYFSGWTAKVNGKEAKIYRANYNFRAVLVPQGKSTLEFSYLPTNFKLGVWLSILSLLGLFLISTLQGRGKIK